MREKLQTGNVAGAALLLWWVALPLVAEEAQPSLLEARRGFKTELIRTLRDAEPLAPPPEQLFSLVHYSDGPHIVALTLLPLAVLAFHAVMSRRTVPR